MPPTRTDGAFRARLEPALTLLGSAVSLGAFAAFVVTVAQHLSSRLGESAVLCPQLEADAQPEYAWRKRKSFHHRDPESTEKTKKMIWSSPCSPCLCGETLVWIMSRSARGTYFFGR